MALQPIEGSITYKNPNARLKKSPVGSQLQHEFFSGSTRYIEWYVVQEDRTLKLVSRDRISR